ncbi:MAG: MbnP family copper-binding protein [Myxococcota bacterium]
MTIASAMAMGTAACGDDEDPAPSNTRSFSVTFAAEVNGQTASCGATYDDVGTSTASYTLGDFRFYVHGVTLIEAGTGAAFFLELDESSVWQNDGVALLDFEDGTGPCMNGTAETNATVTGVAPDRDYDAITFVLGIPFIQNHQDVAVAEAPLNVTSLFWNWNAGYKYARIDGSSDGNPFRFHLGSTGCEMGNDNVVTSCANPNRVVVDLTNFDPDASTVVADIGTVLAQTDTSTSVDPQPGCQSNPTDADCTAIFDNLGLPFGGNAGTGTQSLFTVR